MNFSFLIKKISIITIVSIVVLITACKKDTTTICENLLESGTANLDGLKGDWNFKYFAYSPNGKKYKKEIVIQKGYISITDTGSILLYHTNTINYKYTLSGSNDIIAELKGSTYINPPQEEIDILNAFQSVLCFAIKDNELLLHYTEKDKRNILVLNKK